MEHDQESVISFRFTETPVGFSLPGIGGNFFPKLGVMYREVQGHHGRFPFEAYDLDEVFNVKLENEFPRELPDVFEGFPDEVKREYYTKQASNAADAHNRNQEVRRELRRLERQGHIVIVGDTFMDQLTKKKAESKEKKAPVAAK